MSWWKLFGVPKSSHRYMGSVDLLVSCVLDICIGESGIGIEVLCINLSMLDELEGEVETRLASIDGINFGEEVVEGRRIVKFAVKWNDGQLEEEILDDLSADPSSSSSAVLNTSVAHTAVCFRS